MKNLKYILIVLLAFGCSGSTKKESVSEVKQWQDPILSPYFEIVDALNNDDYSKVREIAAKIQASKANTGVKLAFNSVGKLMSEASSLYDQRAAFKQMAIVLQLYIEQNALNDYPIYKFKCVNNFDNKMVIWYYINEDSKNPFIGGNSDECVELIETIKPVLAK